tara:strand:+ start:220 stop:354 length:135 start_codon:yes stop_codon:yes gene_type:complete
MNNNVTYDGELTPEPIEPLTGGATNKIYFIYCALAIHIILKLKK